jgi:hypothetical protein
MKAAALTLVSLTTIYFLVINHVPLRPWNHLSQARSQLSSSAAGAIPALLVVLALTCGQGLTLAGSWLWIWLLLQIRQWWVPYWLGPTGLHRDFSWYRNGGYDRTLQLLSPAPGRPAPDWQHLVLQILTALASVAVTAQAAAG